MKLHAALFAVCQRDGCNRPVKRANQVHALLGQQRLAKVQAFTGIVIAAHCQNRDISFTQLREKPVKQRDRLTGRNRLIVNISCNHHRIRLMLCRHANHLLQRKPLVIQHRIAVYALAEMQVSEM